MKTLKALTLSLGNINAPVITSYQLGRIIYYLFSTKTYNGEPLNLSKKLAETHDYNKYLRNLLQDGVLNNSRTLPRGVYSLLGRELENPSEIICTINPFCYVSHLSAMAHHGLTDRIPAKLIISSPNPKEWKEYATDKMEKDLSDDYENYIESYLPRLTRQEVTRIRKTEIECINSKHLGAYKNIKGKTTKVSTIGRTFLDMLRNPDLCGGINHVLSVFDEYGQTYLRLITDEIDRNGKQIDKVRAGYILDERMNCSNEIVESWVKFAQRGGSRKLDASTEYIPTWSDKWLLSINVFEKK